LRLTDEQKIAVCFDGHVCLTACPGSGKTRSIVAKLLRSLDLVRDTPHRVACITYTRAAVFEIEKRIRILGSAGDEDLCEISTIHAFCQNNVFRHYHWRLGLYEEGYSVLSPDSEEYRGFVLQIVRQFELSNYAKNEFEQLNRTTDGQPIVTNNITPDAAVAFWDLLERNSYVDFCNLVYFSYLLLNRYPSISHFLSARFPVVLVDEFQDTTDLQVEILRMIAQHQRTRFFIVGDPEQSIFGFAGARPQLMEEFSQTIKAETLSLSGNFRSSPRIVSCAESLIKREPEMFSTGAARDFVEIPAIVHAKSYFEGITDHFLPALEALRIPLGEAAILAHSFFDLLPLGRALRAYGIPIAGPGSRPYRKRSHLYAGLAEQLCCYVDSPNPLQIPHIEKELFYLSQNITGRPNFRIFTFNGRRVVFRLLRMAECLRERSEGAIDWLVTSSTMTADILCEEEIISKIHRKRLSESAEEIIQEIRGQRDIDANNLTIADLGVFASPDKNLKLMTMHRAKGREFQAVALISLHDGQIPYWNYYSPLTDEVMAEARRLFYVGITRAERLLYMFTSEENKRPHSRFLHEINI